MAEVRHDAHALLQRPPKCQSKASKACRENKEKPLQDSLFFLDQKSITNFTHFKAWQQKALEKPLHFQSNYGQSTHALLSRAWVS